MSPRPDQTEPEAPRRLPQKVGGIEMWVAVTKLQGAVYGPFPSQEAALAWVEAETLAGERMWARVTVLLDPDDGG